MPPRSSGPYLYFWKARGLWYIRDRQVLRGTGASRDEFERAQAALDKYLLEKLAATYTPPVERSTDRLLVADVVAYYTSLIPEADARKRASAFYALKPVLEWWGAKPLSDVKRSTCEAYVKHRTSQPVSQFRDSKKARTVKVETARRELTALRAAINAFHAETPLPALPKVWLPSAAPPRDRWLTREEAARFLRAARRIEDKDGRRAIIRFFLLAAYTGTRSGALRSLGWMPNTKGGWIDLDREIIYRKPSGAAESRKRRPPVRIPRQLMVFLREWRRKDLERKIPWVIHFRGHPVEAQRKTWDAARVGAKLGTDVTPHILRHTSATWMMHRRVPLADAAAYLGMSVKTFEEVYYHHHPDYQLEAAGRGGR